MYGVLDPAHAASVSSASDGTALNDNFPLPFGSGTFLSPELTRSKLGRSLILADRWPGVATKLPGGKREGGRGKREEGRGKREAGRERPGPIARVVHESVGDGRDGGDWGGGGYGARERWARGSAADPKCGRG